MKSKFSFLMSLCTLALFCVSSARADIIAYPKKGQSSEQQVKDKSECGQWATQQTGISPENLLKQQQQAANQQPSAGSNAARGAAGGAAVGAVGGAIGGNAGKGAAIGAGAGAVVGASRRRRQEEQIQAQQQAGQAATQDQLATYEKAQKACLTGKGYTVQ